MFDGNENTYNVTFVFDFCTIQANATVKDVAEAEGVAWDWVKESMPIADNAYQYVNDIIVEEQE